MTQITKNKIDIKGICLCAMTIIIIFVLMAIVSCASSRHASEVEYVIHTDTVYITSQQYDSIFIWKDRWTDRTHDTVYMKELSTEYRYRLLRDTLRMVERDSVPYEVVRTETREVERPLSCYTIAMMCYGSPRCCIISITILGVNFLHPSFQPNPLRAD